MNTIKRYLKEENGDGLITVWAIVTDEGNMVSTGFDTPIDPVIIDDPVNSVPEGWSEIDKEDFISEKQLRRQAELDAMEEVNEDIAEREGIIDQLVDNVGDIIGGIIPLK